jgi:ParB family chromosome partitioning protein
LRPVAGPVILDPVAARTTRARKPKVETGSRGLAPRECPGEPPASVRPVADAVTGAGGAVLAWFREPLAGTWLALAALPVERVQPTPFQRDLSETHAKRLSDTIGKLGCYLDPIVAVAEPSGGFWTPNGRHRLEAMVRLGSRSITALVVPDTGIQYKILALNVERAHNLREKALEVARMYRALTAAAGSTPEEQHALEFEEPAFATLGLAYERSPRLAGGAYQPILRRLDGWLDRTLASALPVREERASRVLELDERVSAAVKELQSRGFKSPYLKAFVVARVNPLRFAKQIPPFDEGMADILRRAERFDAARVKQEDIAATGGPPPDES